MHIPVFIVICYCLWQEPFFTFYLVGFHWIVEPLKSLNQMWCLIRSLQVCFWLVCCWWWCLLRAVVTYEIGTVLSFLHLLPVQIQLAIWWLIPVCVACWFSAVQGHYHFQWSDCHQRMHWTVSGQLVAFHFNRLNFKERHDTRKIIN